MNRINSCHRNAIINYLRCRDFYFYFHEFIAESVYQRSIKEAYNWCAIRETIRKGYKRVKE